MSSEQESTTTEGFLIALGINAGLSLFFFTVFVFCRPYKRNIYTPRNHRTDLVEVPPPDMGKSFFSWMWSFLKIDEALIYESVGLDGLMHLKVCQFGFKYCVLASPIGLLFLIPINATGSLKATGFDNLSMANVSDEDFFRNMCHAFSVWYITFLMYYLAHRQYKEYINLRIKFQQEDRPEGYTILVKGIPKDDTSDEGLYKLFNFMYPNAIQDARVLRKNTALKEAIVCRNSWLKKLEAALWSYSNSKKEKRSKGYLKGWYYLFWRGEKVEKISYAQEQLDKYNTIVAEELTDETIKTKSHCGFVTFKELKTAALAAQALHSKKEFIIDVSPAPEPRDVFWGNVEILPREKFVRSFFIFWVTCALIFLWSIPIAALQGLVSIESLSQFLPAFGDFLDSAPALKGLIEGFLPTLILRIFMFLLPKICFLLSRLQGYEANSWIILSQTNKLFWFNFVNVFLVSTFAGTILNSLESIVNGSLGFNEILTLLGTSLPKVATFFINYVMLMTFGGLFFKLSGLFLMLKQRIKLYFFCKTPAQRRKAKAPPGAKYASFYVDTAMVLVLVTTYACISPVIIIFGAAYFVVAYVIGKYQLLFVHVSKYESGGLHWPLLYYYINVGLVVFQLTMFGILLLKKSPFAFVVLPLLLMTYLYYNAGKYLFGRPGRYTPINVATAVDERKICFGEEDTSKRKVFDTYLQPMYKEELTVAPEEMIMEKFEEKQKRFGLSTDILSQEYAETIDVAESNYELHDIKGKQEKSLLA